MASVKIGISKLRSFIKQVIRENVEVDKILKKFNPIAVKHEGDKGNEFFSVLVRDKNSKFMGWIDVDIVDKDIRCQWNKYIFHTNNSDDNFQSAMQDNNYVWDLCTSIAVSYLEYKNLIHQDRQGNWSYTK